MKVRGASPGNCLPVLRLPIRPYSTPQTSLPAGIREQGYKELIPFIPFCDLGEKCQLGEASPGLPYQCPDLDFFIETPAVEARGRCLWEMATRPASVYFQIQRTSSLAPPHQKYSSGNLRSSMVF
jgi:hypothetical protein